jgi:hypothetical protein
VKFSTLPTLTGQNVKMRTKLSDTNPTYKLGRDYERDFILFYFYFLILVGDNFFFKKKY